MSKSASKALSDQEDLRMGNMNSADLDVLCQALLSMSTPTEMTRLLRDLCTRSELEELSRRMAVAALLDEGLSYREIADRTGMSSTTIGRVNEWRKFGMGGYRLALDRIGNNQ